jgi:hypothetical protein
MYVYIYIYIYIYICIYTCELEEVIRGAGVVSCRRCGNVVGDGRERVVVGSERRDGDRESERESERERASESERGGQGGGARRA